MRFLYLLLFQPIKILQVKFTVVSSNKIDWSRYGCTLTNPLIVRDKNNYPTQCITYIDVLKSTEGRQKCKELNASLPQPRSYSESSIFWSFVKKVFRKGKYVLLEHKPTFLNSSYNSKQTGLSS